MGSDPESVMREWFDQVWNNGDASAIDRLFHPDGVFRGLPTPDGQPIRGPISSGWDSRSRPEARRLA